VFCGVTAFYALVLLHIVLAAIIKKWLIASLKPPPNSACKFFKKR